MTAVRTRSEHRTFGGRQGFYEHDSDVCAGPMRFSIFLPPSALSGVRVPAVYYLAGLTCTEETFMIKAGAQRIAAAHSLALVTCDTSPRSARFSGDDASWDFGVGAGFYLDATEPPWNAAYNMYSYVTTELIDVVEGHFPVRSGARGIFGHSMGGHGALTIALKNPKKYQSVSAFAPIVAPSQVPWGVKAFSGYLGPERQRWRAHDAVELVRTHSFPGTILVDQGTADQFLDRELKPELFRTACEGSGQPLELRMQEGYDHSYYFISTFMADHLEHHARALSAQAAAAPSET